MMDFRFRKFYSAYALISISVAAIVVLVLTLITDSLQIERSLAGSDATDGQYTYSSNQLRLSQVGSYSGIDIYETVGTEDFYTLDQIPAKVIEQINFNGSNIPVGSVVEYCLIHTSHTAANQQSSSEQADTGQVANLALDSGLFSPIICTVAHMDGGSTFNWSQNLPNQLILEDDRYFCNVSVYSENQLGYVPLDFEAAQFSCDFVTNSLSSLAADVDVTVSRSTSYLSTFQQDTIEWQVDSEVLDILSLDYEYIPAYPRSLQGRSLDSSGQQFQQGVAVDLCLRMSGEQLCVDSPGRYDISDFEDGVFEPVYNLNAQCQGSDQSFCNVVLTWRVNPDMIGSLISAQQSLGMALEVVAGRQTCELNSVFSSLLPISSRYSANFSELCN